MIAPEGYREIAAATAALAAAAGALGWLVSPYLAIPCALIWIWVLAFFRDPDRSATVAPGDLCAPADGTVTEITELDGYDFIEGHALRIGIFLSLFNVHVNRSPCAGRVRSRSYRRGEFLDARHPESGRRNEAMTLVVDPDPPLPGPVVVRQVAGLVARRIVCHAHEGDQLLPGARFGMIKFGSRTELILPRRETTEVLVTVGDKVRGGLTILARQPAAEPTSETPAADELLATLSTHDASTHKRTEPHV